LSNPLKSVDRKDVDFLSKNPGYAQEKLRQEYARAFCTSLSDPWQMHQLHFT